MLIYIWSDWKISDEIIENDYKRNSNDWYITEPWDNVPEKFKDISFVLVAVNYDSIKKQFIIVDGHIKVEYNFVNKALREKGLDILHENFDVEYTGSDNDPVNIIVDKNNCVIS